MISNSSQPASWPDWEKKERRRKIEQSIRRAEKSELPQNLIDAEVAAQRRLLANVHDPLRYAVVRYLIMIESGGLNHLKRQQELKFLYSQYPGEASEINLMIEELSGSDSVNSSRSVQQNSE